MLGILCCLWLFGGLFVLVAIPVVVSGFVSFALFLLVGMFVCHAGAAVDQVEGAHSHAQLQEQVWFQFRSFCPQPRVHGPAAAKVSWSPVRSGHQN